LSLFGGEVNHEARGIGRGECQERQRHWSGGVFLFLITPFTVLPAILVKPPSVKFSIVAMSTIVQDLEDENTES
jgi:hypothetical protein